MRTPLIFFPYDRVSEREIAWDPWMEERGQRGPLRAGSILDAWDSLTPLRFRTTVRYDPERVRESTGIRDISHIRAVAVADCVATGRRFTGTSPLDPSARSVPVSVDIPATFVRDSVVLSADLVLVEGAAEDAPTAPGIPFSRLGVGPQRTTIKLEREGGLDFPIRAVSFAKLFLEQDLLWSLLVRPTDFDSPICASVSLRINTDHPQSEELLRATELPGRLARMLQAELARRMLFEGARLRAMGEALPEEPAANTFGALVIRSAEVIARGAPGSGMTVDELFDLIDDRDLGRIDEALSMVFKPWEGE